MRTLRDVLREADPVRHEPPRHSRGSELRRIFLAATLGRTSRRAASPRVHSRVAAVAIGIAIIAVLAAAPRSWWGGGVTLQAAVRFEVHLAETDPAPGLREMKIGERILYLHLDPVVTNEDISSASVISDRNASAFDVAIVFTAQGAEKMRAATTGHRGLPMAILIDDQLVAAPVIDSPIDRDALITGNFTKQEAERIANGVTIR